MNTHDHEPQIDEALWLAQEKARRGDADADPDELRIARALRRAPAVDLPFDFATTVARSAASQVASLARAQAVANSALEQRLLRGLVLVFAVSAAVVVAWYGRAWPAALAAVLPGGSDAVGWSGAAALCVLANWGFGALRGCLQRGSRPGA